MEIRLIVLRTTDPKRLADFYSLLGLTFDYHQHGNSPFHFAASLGSMVLEIYPLAKGQTGTDPHLRLGFTVDNFEEILGLLAHHHIPFSAPTSTDYGFLTVVSDPDGRKIELYKKSHEGHQD